MLVEYRGVDFHHYSWGGAIVIVLPEVALLSSNQTLPYNRYLIIDKTRAW